MKSFYLSIFSLLSWSAFGSSCCVSNTSLPNLMTMPARWQQTYTFANSRVIGDVNSKGQSEFRRSSNKETTTFGRMDLSYQWKDKFQTGVGARYQQKSREYDDSSANDSG